MGSPVATSLDLDVRDLDVIADPAAAAAALEPLRAQILAILAEPGSASSVAAELNQSRQKVNYHLRILEAHGLITMVEERPKRGLTERIMQATAHSYVMSPEVLGASASRPDRVERNSSRYLIAIAARLVREVGAMLRQADKAAKAVPTLAIDTEIRFANPGDRALFAADMADAVATIAASYHQESATDGRWYRLVVAAHPHPRSRSDKRHEESREANDD